MLEVFHTLESLSKEYKRLEEAYKLLEQVYVQYELLNELPEELRFKMRDFFGYDDSE